MKPFGTKAFSMVEILAVTALVGILAALSFGAVSNLQGSANATKCLSNLRQIGVAVQMFVGDNNATLPATSHLREEDGTSLSWTTTIAGYLSKESLEAENFIGKCPSAKSHPVDVTYGWNDLLADPDTYLPMRITACRSPSSTMLLAELADHQTSDHIHFSGLRHRAARITPVQFRSFVNPVRHGRGSTYLFVDGHAEMLDWSEVQRRISQPGNSFITP